MNVSNPAQRWRAGNAQSQSQVEERRIPCHIGRQMVVHRGLLAVGRVDAVPKVKLTHAHAHTPQCTQTDITCTAREEWHRVQYLEDEINTVQSRDEPHLTSSLTRSPQRIWGPRLPSGAAPTGQQPCCGASTPSRLGQDRRWSTAGGLLTGGNQESSSTVCCNRRVIRVPVWHLI